MADALEFQPHGGALKRQRVEPLEVSTADLAQILGVTGRRIQQLENAQVLRSVRHGAWDLRHAVQAFVKYQVDSEAAKYTKTRGKARERLDQVKAEREALKFAQESGRIIPTEEAIAVVDELVGTIRAGFAGLPARVTRDLKQRAAIETEVDAVLTRAADQFSERAAALRARGVFDPAAAEA